MQTYLTKTGERIYKEILSYLDNKEINSHLLSMIANSFDTFADCAEIIKREGRTQQTKTGFLTVRPEVGIMQKAYLEIIKLSPLVGLDPASRKRVFKLAELKKKKKTFLTCKADEEKAFTEWWSDTENEGPPDMNYLPAYLKYRFANHEEPVDLLQIL